jgi:outer membrane protein assembly factor BamB
VEAKPHAKLIPVATAALAGAALGGWLLAPPPVAVNERVPQGRPEAVAAANAPADANGGRAELIVAAANVPTTLPADAIGGRRTGGDGRPAALGGDWPQFRGPRRDAISREAVGLARDWPEGGPKVLWRRRLGRGHAGPVVRNGRVYLLDYDEAAGQDVLRCMSLADGRDIWRYAYPVRITFDHGFTRTVPAVADGHVVTLGPKAHVLCLDANSGRPRWAMDLRRQLGTEIPAWYAGQCPLIDDGRAILAPAGPNVLMTAVACRSGEVAWQTPNPMGWSMTHSSIAVATLAGHRTYVYCGSEGVVGVAADDGRILWQTTAWSIKIATVATPVPVGDDRLLLAGGYRRGAMMLGLDAEGDRIVPRVRYELTWRQFGARQHTPILYQGNLYGVRPNGEMACLAPGGRLRWTSGQSYDFGLGPYLIADGLIFAMDPRGVLTVAEADADVWRPLARATVIPDARDAWAPMAIAGGRLLARDLTQMVCLDVRAEAGG